MYNGKFNHNNITLKPINRSNVRGVPKIVLKRDSNGVLQHNDAENAQKAVTQFKELINIITEEQTERDETRENMPMIDTESTQLVWDNENSNINTEAIHGLTQNENEELRGVLFLNCNAISDPKSCIGPEDSLQKQVDYISETIGYIEREFDRTSN